MQARTFRYRNPIYSPAIEAIRDCQITEVDGMYYLTGTSPPFWEGPNPGVKLYCSPDLLNWKFETLLIDRARLDPGVWYYDRFWAPEIHRAGGRFWLTFNCRNETAEIPFPHSVGLAVAESITGPYEVLTHDKPLIERANDATLFTDDDDRTYIYAAARTGGNHGIRGWELNLEACRLVDGGFVCFQKNREKGNWESVGIEGPFVIKRDGAYYMFYSGWARGYEVGYATAAHPKGPWRKYEGNPIFGAQSKEVCEKKRRNVHGKSARLPLRRSRAQRHLHRPGRARLARLPLYRSRQARIPRLRSDLDRGRHHQDQRPDLDRADNRCLTYQSGQGEQKMNKWAVLLILSAAAVGCKASKANKTTSPTASRWLCAAPKASGQIGLSWRLDADPKRAGYNLYRSTTSGSGYVKINKNLITTTSYVDSGLSNGTTYYYVVRAATNKGAESPDSNQAKATATSDSVKFNRVLTINHGEDCWGRVGDLNNDGNIDFLFQKGAVYIKAYDHTGRLMWQKAMNSPDGWGHGSWRMHPQPTVIWDIDQDGKNEVVCGNFYEGGKYHVAIIDGATGRIEKKKELPTGILRLEVGSVANLRGTAKPQDFVLSSSLGKDYTRRIYAFDNNLKLLWTWTNDDKYGEQCHRYKVGDVDYDGKDEVCVGEILLNGNGKVRWVQDRSRIHQDSIEIVELDGDKSNGREVLVGYNHPASKLMCINGPSGTLRWEKSFKEGGTNHCIHGMEPYEFRTEYPGKEIFFFAKVIRKFILVKKDGSEIWKITADSNNEGNSIYWRGGPEADIIGVSKITDSRGNVISTRPEPHTSEMYLFISGDVIGDYREEYFAADRSGKIHLYSNVAHNPTSKKSFWESDPERVWVKYVNTDDY